MLLPNDKMLPEESIYYKGSLVLKALEEKNNQSMLDLFQKVRESDNMSFSTFLLCLDWLYLIKAAEMDDNGHFLLCSK